MAITNTQQGVITEAEFSKIIMISSGGLLVPARPLADDERRDFEIHVRRHFREVLATQIKTAKRLRLHGRARVLQINFRLKAPLVSDARLWYFLAYFDIETMRFIDPVFLVPSKFFHKHALHGIGRGMIQMQFKASMETGARDLWRRWALPQADLGNRILEILEDLNRQPALSRKVVDLLSHGDVVLLGRAPRLRGVSQRQAA